jgi:hypothetical protein
VLDVLVLVVTTVVVELAVFITLRAVSGDEPTLCVGVAGLLLTAGDAGKELNGVRVAVLAGGAISFVGVTFVLALALNLALKAATLLGLGVVFNGLPVVDVAAVEAGVGFSLIGVATALDVVLVLIVAVAVRVVVGADVD